MMSEINRKGVAYFTFLLSKKALYESTLGLWPFFTITELGGT